MTRNQKILLLKRIAEVEDEIEKMKKVRLDIVTSGSSAISMSSGGGSKSLTRLDLGKITETINELIRELKSLRSKLSGRSVSIPSRIVTIFY